MLLRTVTFACLASTIACSTPTGELPLEESHHPYGKADGFEDLSRPCVFEAPFEADGYTAFAPVDAANVTRVLDDNDRATVSPTHEELYAAMANISAYIDGINESLPAGTDHRRREVYRETGGTPEPYCLFHAENKPIYGTVMLFHGFNDRPQQQASLASYLFHSGYNVYNVFLAHHYEIPGTSAWPKVRYRDDLLQIIAAKVADPANAALIEVVRAAAPNLGPEDMAAIDAMLQPELSIAMLDEAWHNPGGPEFQRIFEYDGDPSGGTRDFSDYVSDAAARLADLGPLPGPVFVSGLSVGGTTALALAERDGGDRIEGVISQAPWLRPHDPNNLSPITFAGPLDDNIRLIGGEYPIYWENNQSSLSPASVSANLALGAWVGRPENVARLANVPVSFVTTALDDSASGEAIAELVAGLNALSGDPSRHVIYEYAAERGVGHALTDPENYVSDDIPAGGGWNRYWRTLYQEVNRAFLTGAMSPENLNRAPGFQDDQLPQVGCTIPGRYAYRCGG